MIICSEVSLVLNFLSTLLISQINAGSVCNIRKTVRFSFNSFQNQSGEWLSEVGLQHEGGNLKANKTVLWSVDLEHNINTSCEGDNTISIIAILTVPQPSPVKKIIPPGYDLYSGVGYYKLYTAGTKWANAKQTCQDEGSHLVVINSEKEAATMKQLFTKFSSKITGATRKDFLWVGIYEQGFHGNYFTIFGDLLVKTGFSRWSPGDPNLAGTDDCIVIYESNLGLVDVSCTDLYAFVCEIPETK